MVNRFGRVCLCFLLSLCLCGLPALAAYYHGDDSPFGDGPSPVADPGSVTGSWELAYPTNPLTPPLVTSRFSYGFWKTPLHWEVYITGSEEYSVIPASYDSSRPWMANFQIDGTNFYQNALDLFSVSFNGASGTSLGNGVIKPEQKPWRIVFDGTYAANPALIITTFFGGPDQVNNNDGWYYIDKLIGQDLTIDLSTSFGGLNSSIDYFGSNKTGNDGASWSSGDVVTDISLGGSSYSDGLSPNSKKVCFYLIDKSLNTQGIGYSDLREHVKYTINFTEKSATQYFLPSFKEALESALTSAQTDRNNVELVLAIEIPFSGLNPSFSGDFKYWSYDNVPIGDRLAYSIAAIAKASWVNNGINYYAVTYNYSTDGSSPDPDPSTSPDPDPSTSPDPGPSTSPDPGPFPSIPGEFDLNVELSWSERMWQSFNNWWSGVADWWSEQIDKIIVGFGKSPSPSPDATPPGELGPVQDDITDIYDSVGVKPGFDWFDWFNGIQDWVNDKLGVGSTG